MMTHPDIGAYYPCYKQPKAILAAVEAYRRHYPTGTLVVVSDNGHDYRRYVEEQGGIYRHCEEQLGSSVTTTFSGVTKAVEFLRRFLEGAMLIRESHFLLLEDDVAVLDRVPVEALEWDVTGCNRRGPRGAHMPQAMHDCLKARYSLQRGQQEDLYYGGCGGSVFRTAFVQDMARKMGGRLREEVEEYAVWDPHLYSDMMLSFFAMKYGGTVGGPPDALCERGDPMCAQRVLRGVAKVVHQWKRWYNVPLTKEEKAQLGL